MLSNEQRDLVTSSINLVDIVAKMTVRKSGPMTDDRFEELKAELSKALVESADRWPRYCEENGYDPKAVEYFRPFALFRLQGAVIDSWRKTSALTKTEIKYIQYSNKHSVAEAALFFGVSPSIIEKAQKLRSSILYPVQVDTYSEVLTHEHEDGDAPYRLLAQTLRTLPKVAQAYVALVYLVHVHPMTARSLLGIRHNSFREFQSWVEYELLTPVLLAGDSNSYVGSPDDQSSVA